ncbi:YbaB/EbfC family nucleoid-associated protein [Sphaerisporangium sp. TRM90804]|uniref:YbaB/EbfC family nucleoid-associated protein n=1 Tax=Sphaerisporangium sp. TRM90804 TaxID=3031113 RepID=UPI002447FB51|nr:YbaB/EbfC family nucleoid-associated protein [Sphaerisporangium sp. TRM90804]MDH2427931.1 YbaB/EbfC family nucleoid-associated protein [Sphaerisporangium sp. TRM90804]
MNGFDPNPAHWRDGDLELDAERAAKILAWVEDGQHEVDAIIGVGEAGDGQVKVTTTAEGRVREVTLAPRAMRLDSESLADELLLAVRRAQDDAENATRRLMQDALGDVLPPGALDPAAVEEQIGRLLRSFTRP